jgi:hypothetical protein
MPLKRLTKAKHAANLIVIYSVKTFNKLTFKFFINIVITNAFKAYLQGIAFLAKRRKLAYI